MPVYLYQFNVQYAADPTASVGRILEAYYCRVHSRLFGCFAAMAPAGRRAEQGASSVMRTYGADYLVSGRVCVCVCVWCVFFVFGVSSVQF